MPNYAVGQKWKDNNRESHGSAAVIKFMSLISEHFMADVTGLMCQFMPWPQKKETAVIKFMLIRSEHHMTDMIGAMCQNMPWVTSITKVGGD